MTDTQESRFRGAVSIAALALLAGCGDGASLSEHDETLELAREMAHSEFQREILADGVVTRAELDEATTRLGECLAAFGIDMEVVEEYGVRTGLVLTFPGRDTMDAEVDDCFNTYMGMLDTYYTVTHVTNPNDENPDQLMVDCFIRHGLVQDSFTVADLHEWEEAGDAREPSYDDEVVLLCSINPSYG